MISANELRLGNLVTWNPGLLHPTSTLPPLQVQVFAVFSDKISYVFPNIENRVEPFEDDVVQFGNRLKNLEELEPIELTPEILINEGFEQKKGLLSTTYFEKGDLQLQQKDGYFVSVIVTTLNTHEYRHPVKYFHQLQNLYFALMGEELEVKLHGQQA